jgi:hypothetical protein
LDRAVPTNYQLAAKVFAIGNTQAIRLPKAFRLDAQMAAIAQNPLHDHFLSDASRQNSPPKNRKKPAEDQLTQLGQ